MVVSHGLEPRTGESEQVRAFINTWDADEDAEHLPGPAELRDWLVEQDLLAPSDPVTAADHRHALEVREALRAVLLANSGLDLDRAPGRSSMTRPCGRASASASPPTGRSARA